MATVAGLRKSALDVARILAVLEILEMAAHAGGLRQAVIVVDVAIRAGSWRHHVLAREREAGLGVIEVRRRPGDRRMARFAGLCESLLCVIRVVRVLEILEMAAHSRGLRQVVVVVDVAVDARPGWHGVHAGKGEPGERMIKLGVQPVVGRVARLAGRGKFAGYVVGILDALKIFLMAAVARCRHRIEIAECAILVTVVAGRRGMRTGQGETVHMLVDLLHRNFPSPDGVAGLAIRAHLALVNVGVAVGAFVADVAENHLGMAGGAGDAFVQSA